MFSLYDGIFIVIKTSQNTKTALFPLKQNINLKTQEEKKERKESKQFSIFHFIYYLLLRLLFFHFVFRFRFRFSYDAFKIYMYSNRIDFVIYVVDSLLLLQ